MERGGTEDERTPVSDPHDPTDPDGMALPSDAGDPGWCLIVEDDPEIAGLIRLLVDRISGLPIEVRHSGTEAIELLGRRARPVVAILDIMLPGADGIEVASALRAVPNGRRTRLIFLSAVAQERVQRELEPLDPFTYLRKPVRLGSLQEVILSAFDAAERSLELVADLSEELSEYMDSIDQSAEISWD